MRFRPRKQSSISVLALAAFAIVLCAGAGLIAFLLINRSTRAVAQSQTVTNRIVYGLTLLPSGFDPHVNASSELGIVLRSVYDTLVYRDPQTKEFVPGLAASWTISPDGLTYTFKLKSGIKFHDGTVFNVQAVAATLDRITNPATKSQKALFLLGPYDKYNIVDTETIQIILKQPYAPLLDGLAQVYTGIASPKATGEWDTAQYQFHQAGTGPFRMVDYIPGDRFVIRRNKEYAWGPKFYNPMQPNSVEEVEFRFFTDPATRAPALETGAAQIMGELSPTDALLFSGNSDIRLIPQSVPGEPLNFLINTGRAPTDKVEFRRALIQLTNRTAIVDSVFQQFSAAAYGPISAVTPFYDPVVKKFYPFDVGAAQEALIKLGYSDSDGDKILDKGGQKLRLIMVAPPWGFIPQVAQKLQSQWKEVGIELTLKQVPNFVSLVEIAQSGEYNLLAYDDFGVDPALLDGIFRSNGPNNWTHYSNNNLDSWLTRATTATDAETRKNMYTAIQNHIMEQALILPIRDYVNLNGVRANVNGLTFDAYGWFPLLPNLTLGEASKSSKSTAPPTR